ncbi:MAG: hypothetical protein GXO63_02665 [Candidatus Micrarchaeota archaeon]|nr:hypothetical protein [Candidatus Micrarchaeota archaeon]
MRTVVIVAIFFLLGFVLSNALFTHEKIIYVQMKSPGSNESSITMRVPAVDENGNGVLVDLTVETRPGKNRILANIDKLLFWVDTQHSIQTAKEVAVNLTGIDTSGLDIIYTINTNASIVGGPSAGAALTVATISALLNKTPRKDVVITGTINPDGTIGEVGGILEKAEAAKRGGAKMILVPKGQRTEVKVVPNETCVSKPGFLYCETVYVKKRIDISKRVGITVREVENISEALGYFF